MKAHGDGDGVVERCTLVCPSVPALPDEIVVEILLRLPVKPLLQFKLVCKSWKTLISSHQFAIDNLRQRSSAEQHLPSHLVYSNKYYDYSRLGFLPLQPLFKNPPEATRFVHFGMSFDIGGEFRINELVIRGSCNGLLWLHHLPSGSFCLWNPCTRSASQCFRIELLPPLIYFGLGYDHVYDKYKLVTVHEQDSTRIFTFGANSWSIGPNFPYPAVGFSGKIGKFLSGAAAGTLNWMAKMNEKEWVILSFDLANETFSQVSLPRLNGVDHNTCDPELQVSMNCICFTIQKESVFEVWMMKEYGVWESWMMILRANRLLDFYDSLIPLSISERHVLLLLLPHKSLVLYNYDDGMFYFPLKGQGEFDDAIRSPVCYKGVFFSDLFCLP